MTARTTTLCPDCLTHEITHEITHERNSRHVTVGAQELVELVQIGNRLADEGESFDRAEEWFRANAALARTVELEDAP